MARSSEAGYGTALVAPMHQASFESDGVERCAQRKKESSLVRGLRRFPTRDA